MANAFSKAEVVAFEEALQNFEDNLILSRNIKKYNTNSKGMERSGDIIWRPQSYIPTVYTGTDMTNNFKDITQLSVPAVIGTRKSVPFQMTDTELRDPEQAKNYIGEGVKGLASAVNVDVQNVACNQGTLWVKRTVAPTGYDDVALPRVLMSEQGITHGNRHIALAGRDYNTMAGNLAGRQTLQDPKTLPAYEESYIGKIAGFRAWELDYANTLILAGATGVTVNGANQYYTPLATTTDALSGQAINVDNRYQNLAITVTSGTVKVGDAFTIAGVFATNHYNKIDTRQLKTFRVTRIISGAGGTGTIQISPPIISAQGASGSELQYQNVTATPANGATITFLNTANSFLNPFWQQDAIELLPSEIPTGDEDAGVSIMKATTESGLSVIMYKQFDINLAKYKYRLDTRYGICVNNPEMVGCMQFYQV